MTTENPFQLSVKLQIHFSSLEAKVTTEKSVQVKIQLAVWILN